VTDPNFKNMPATTAQTAKPHEKGRLAPWMVPLHADDCHKCRRHNPVSFRVEPEQKAARWRQPAGRSGLHNKRDREACALL